MYFLYFMKRIWLLYILNVCNFISVDFCDFMYKIKIII